MIAYLSGKLSADPASIYELADAEMVLQHLGYDVLSAALIPPGIAGDANLVLRCAMMDICDVVVQLDSWRSSADAQRDRRYALAIGKNICSYNETIRRARPWESARLV